ncbi:ATP-binding cassette domain-containing protein, partial [Desulfobacterales bacterium HSG17]|nr:ATP-binding cassette domain-containing protein [Desulfobacterales bacterium HSG17]
FIYKVIKNRIDNASTIAREYLLTIHKEASMSIQGIKDVKIYGCENLLISKYLKNAIPLSKIFGIQAVYGSLSVRILETVGFGMLYISICIMLLKFDITTAYVTGIMALLAVTAWRVLPAISQIVNSLSVVRKILPYMRILIDYITLIETNSISNNQALEQVSSFSFVNSIKFENVCFSYQADGVEIIQDLSFKINKGETIGIIGTSGSGKSTLVDLIIGLLKPVKGTIYIDHQRLSNDNLASWLKITGYVPQSPYIYDETIAENIAFGVDHKTIDRTLIRKCCTMASMDDFVNNLHDNIDSFIGERGVKLSGGQQQRVSIARALYREPEVMIFDEATSSLDTKSEKTIQETIYSFKGKQTLIIVAHRLSTVEDCDEIIWIDKGKIKMMGKARTIIKAYRKNLEAVL